MFILGLIVGVICVITGTGIIDFGFEEMNRFSARNPSENTTFKDCIFSIFFVVFGFIVFLSAPIIQFLVMDFLKG